MSSLIALAAVGCGARSELDGPQQAARADVSGADVVSVSQGCQATAQGVLATGERFPTGIAVDGTHVYWTALSATGLGCQSDVVRSAPIGGGAAVTLATGQENPREIVVDDGTVYWSGGCNFNILRSVPVGGGPIRDYPLQGRMGEGGRALGVDRQNIYLNDYGMLSVPRAGGAQRDIDAQNYVYALAVDDAGLFWVGPVGGRSPMGLFSLPAGAAQPTRVLLPASAGLSMALDAEWVYFVGDGVQRMRRSGGAIETVVDVMNQPSRIALRDGVLYWSTGYPGSGGYTLHRRDADGRDVVLARGPSWIQRMAVDDRCVYFTLPTENAIGVAPIRTP